MTDIVTTAIGVVLGYVIIRLCPVAIVGVIIAAHWVYDWATTDTYAVYEIDPTKDQVGIHYIDEDEVVNFDEPR